VPSHKMARWSHLQLKDCGQGLEAWKFNRRD
jgi:hypothetical protein